MDRIRILIIDDDPDQCDLTREVLEDRFGRGCAESACDGRSALAKDLASFDLILCDFNLPDCTGLDLLDQIRSRCKTPVILVTGENVGEFAAEAIRRGAADYIVKVHDYFFTIPLVVEKNLAMARLARENEELRRKLESALSDVKKANDQLHASLARVEQLAATDPLTGLYNRRHFNVVLDQLFAESSRYGTDLTCVMIDLDKYKQLNDSMGHQVGDQVLVVVGEILRHTIRRADVAARYGGDEFVLLLPHADANEARTLVERIRDEYRRRTAELLRREQGMTMSVGLASLKDSAARTADQFVAAADSALYASKEAGRDRITVAPPRSVLLAG